jgi:hypothetical protein
MAIMRPESFYNSLIIDTAMMGFLFILSLRAVAGESSAAKAFQGCGAYSECQ